MSNQTNKDKLKHFPLELTDDLHFVGDRPLSERVEWKTFKKLIKKGQKKADDKWEKESYEQI